MGKKIKKDKFVFITDLHIANKQPVSRIDNYNESIFKKLKWVLGYCVRNKVKKLIIGGDLFHSYKIADELAVQFVDIIQEYELEKEGKKL